MPPPPLPRPLHGPPITLATEARVLRCLRGVGVEGRALDRVPGSVYGRKKAMHHGGKLVVNFTGQSMSEARRTSLLRARSKLSKAGGDECDFYRLFGDKNEAWHVKGVLIRLSSAAIY